MPPKSIIQTMLKQCIDTIKQSDAKTVSQIYYIITRTHAKGTLSKIAKDCEKMLREAKRNGDDHVIARVYKFLQSRGSGIDEEEISGSGIDINKLIHTVKTLIGVTSKVARKIHELGGSLDITDHERDMITGGGFFDFLNPVNLIKNVARPLVAPVGDFLSKNITNSDLRLGSAADKILDAVGLGIPDDEGSGYVVGGEYKVGGSTGRRKRRGGEYQIGGDYVIGGSVDRDESHFLGRTAASRPPQRYLDPSDYV